MMIEGLGGAVNDWAQGRHQQRMGVLGDAIFGRTQQQAPRTYDADKTDVILAKLKADRDISIARYHGASAQVAALHEALKKADPKNLLLQQSDQRYKDGKMKSRLRLFFDAAFDKALRELGGALSANPSAHRY
jgi:hypothetical protein